MIKQGIKNIIVIDTVDKYNEELNKINAKRRLLGLNTFEDSYEGGVYTSGLVEAIRNSENVGYFGDHSDGLVLSDKFDIWYPHCWDEFDSLEDAALIFEYFAMDEDGEINYDLVPETVYVVNTDKFPVDNSWIKDLLNNKEVA